MYSHQGTLCVLHTIITVNAKGLFTLYSCFRCNFSIEKISVSDRDRFQSVNLTTSNQISQRSTLHIPIKSLFKTSEQVNSGCILNIGLSVVNIAKV